MASCGGQLVTKQTFLTAHVVPVKITGDREVGLQLPGDVLSCELGRDQRLLTDEVGSLGFLGSMGSLGSLCLLIV